PYINAQIITKSEYTGAIMNLAISKRGILKNQVYLTTDRVELTFELPLSEIVFDFYDKLKSVSKGYASFDYHPIGYRDSNLVKLDILLNGDLVDALSALIYRESAVTLGRKIREKLKELIPRQQFTVAIQAAVGAKIIARETIKAHRKDVTAKCYGGDITRKRKLLEKKGGARLVRLALLGAGVSGGIELPIREAPSGTLSETPPGSARMVCCICRINTAVRPVKRGKVSRLLRQVGKTGGPGRRRTGGVLRYPFTSDRPAGGDCPPVHGPPGLDTDCTSCQRENLTVAMDHEVAVYARRHIVAAISTAGLRSVCGVPRPRLWISWGRPVDINHQFLRFIKYSATSCGW
ncbi:MAG: hypothetical protein IIC07_06420, partial [Proteobacteria bacterium]|nr:hypothetical protein [Pseudomonadota bacterium]